MKWLLLNALCWCCLLELSQALQCRHCMFRARQEKALQPGLHFAYLGMCGLLSRF